MVVCPNGSVPKPGQPTQVVIDNNWMASLLPGGLQWLADFLPYIPPMVFDVALLCSDDPPGYPDTSLIEWAALVAGSPAQAAQESGRQVAQALYNLVWYQLCHCLVDATPAPPAPPAAPANLPTVNPPALVSPPAAASCQGRQLIAGGFLGGNIKENQDPTPLPANATLIRATFTAADFGSPTHGTQRYSIQFVGADHLLDLGITRWDVARNSTLTVDVRVPVGAVYVWTGVQSLAGNTSDSYYGTGLVYCNGQTPGVPIQPCCPPDANVRGLLAQIRNLTTLIQRQAAPFAYIYGANHTALSGQGSFAVSGLIGVSVDVTTLPARAGQAAGTPLEYFDLGFVTLGTADGWDHSRRIDHDGTLLLPPGAGVFTTVGYTLTPGVEVAIRELVREP